MLVSTAVYLSKTQAYLQLGQFQQKMFCVRSSFKNLYKTKQILWLGKVFSVYYCLPSVFILSSSALACHWSHGWAFECSESFLVTLSSFCVLQAAKQFSGEKHPPRPNAVSWIVHLRLCGPSSAHRRAVSSPCLLLPSCVRLDELCRAMAASAQFCVMDNQGVCVDCGAAPSAVVSLICMAVLFLLSLVWITSLFCWL